MFESALGFPPEESPIPYGPYELRRYGREWEAQVAELQVHLWGPDLESNRRYLRWKHFDNPYANEAAAFMALLGDQVVAFRGFFPNVYHVPESLRRWLLMAPGDAVVHPDHRRKGLFQALTEWGTSVVRSRSPLLLSMSSNRRSGAGYIKMGFVPLLPGTYLSRATLTGIARHSLWAKRTLPLADARIRFGRHGTVLVSPDPLPEEMAWLAERSTVPGRLQLHQDPAFFAWRYRNPRGKYVFYYLMEEERVLAYLVLGISPNNQRGFLLDYGEARLGQITQLVRFAASRGPFGVLSLYRFAAEPYLLKPLRTLGFTDRGLFPFLESRLQAPTTVLVRPTLPDPADGAFLVEGLDMRRAHNWFLKPICSDGA